MKHFLLAMILAFPMLAADLPTLTVEQKLQVREAQLRLATVMSQRRMLQDQWITAETERMAAGKSLNALVESLKPEKCKKCTLAQDLTWRRPAPPKK